MWQVVAMVMQPQTPTARMGRVHAQDPAGSLSPMQDLVLCVKIKEQKRSEWPQRRWWLSFLSPTPTSVPRISVQLHLDFILL